MKARCLMWVLWPAFLMALVTSAIVFALVDPHDMIVLDQFRESRMMVYSAGFFLFWAMGALSSALTLRLAPCAACSAEDADLP